MSITINWLSQALKNIDGIEIYRRTGHSATIDLANLGAPLATLSKNVTTYVDTTVENKKVYRYWIAAVKGTDRTLNSPITQGFFLNMGPGPRELKRGTWQYGWFGKVSSEEMFTHAEVRGLIPKLNMFSVTPEFWDKFIFNGTILFIPNRAMGYATFNALYNAGITYGIDSSPTPPSGSSATNQLTKITKGNDEFIIRLPRLSGTSNLSVDTYDGEIRATMARMVEAKGSNRARVMEGKMDYRSGMSSLSANSKEGSWTTNNYISNLGIWCAWDAANPEYLSVATVATSYPFTPVFELVQP